jgi:hypothetical protein
MYGVIPLRSERLVARMGSPGVPLGPPFDIPDFNHSGILPPFLGSTPTEQALMSPFETTLTRVAGKLCKSNERKEIFRGLLKYRKELAKLGFTKFKRHRILLLSHAPAVLLSSTLILRYLTMVAFSVFR